MGHPHWPLFDLQVTTPRLTLRYIDDDIAIDMVELAARGIHEPGWMPFSIPWTNVESPELERNSLQYYWRCRAETTVDHWDLPLAVIVDGTVVGASGLRADDFPTMRQFESGSWLGREFQGQGIGKELRVATLTLGFVGLGAEFATTGAWFDNGPSLGVTRSLGYTETATHRRMRLDHPDRLLQFEMSRAHFVEHVQRDDIALGGVDAARDLLGLDERC
jgi:RimJ/RimL family protein N-acetyltransferase